jgi:hypothetical protein
MKNFSRYSFFSLEEKDRKAANLHDARAKGAIAYICRITTNRCSTKHHRTIVHLADHCSPSRARTYGFVSKLTVQFGLLPPPKLSLLYMRSCCRPCCAIAMCFGVDSVVEIFSRNSSRIEVTIPCRFFDGYEEAARRIDL